MEDCIIFFKSHTATGGWGNLWPANAGPLGSRLVVAVWDLKNFIQPRDKYYLSLTQLGKRIWQPRLLVSLGGVPVPLVTITIDNKLAKCARQNVSKNEF